MKILLITYAIGRQYRDAYNKSFKKSHKEYAKKHGYDFKIKTDYIGKLKTKDVIYFDKYLLAEENKTYDYIIYVGSDVLINTNSPCIIRSNDLGDKIGCVSHDQPSREARIIRAQKYGFEITPNEYYENKLKIKIDFEIEHYINADVFIFQPEKHKVFLRNLYDKYAHLITGHPSGPHFEQASSGYEMQKNNLVKIIDIKWNAIWAYHKFYIENNNIKYSLQDFVNDNYFIHFAGKTDINLAHTLKYN